MEYTTTCAVEHIGSHTRVQVFGDEFDKLVMAGVEPKYILLWFAKCVYDSDRNYWQCPNKFLYDQLKANNITIAAMQKAFGDTVILSIKKPQKMHRCFSLMEEKEEKSSIKLLINGVSYTDRLDQLTEGR